MPDARITWCHDTRPADWILPRLHPGLVGTGSVVPEGFDAYCRLFHPVVVPGRNGVVKRWAEVAAENGRVVHPEMQFHMINRPVGTLPPKGYQRGDGLEWGSLPRTERSLLLDVLRSETTTPDRCWFCVWGGYSGLDFRGVSERVSLPGRDYVLYAGPIEVALASLDPPWDRHSPNIWWPDDRSWIVVTEIDYAWTYVGGNRTLIDRLLAHDRLEALPARLTDKPFYDSDVVNALSDATDVS